MSKQPCRSLLTYLIQNLSLNMHQWNISISDLSIHDTLEVAASSRPLCESNTQFLLGNLHVVMLLIQSNHHVGRETINNKHVMCLKIGNTHCANWEFKVNHWIFVGASWKKIRWLVMQCPTYFQRLLLHRWTCASPLVPASGPSRCFPGKRKTNQWVYSSSNGRFKYAQLRAGWGPSSLAKLVYDYNKNSVWYL